MAKCPRVRLQNRQRRLKVDAARLRVLTERVLREEGAAETGQVELVLLRDGPMSLLNQRYRRRQGPTDVLTFPVDPTGWPPEEPPILGTIVVSVDRAVEQAAARRASVVAEIDRLLVHGLLHLMGHRHRTPPERARMQRRERHFLRSRTGREVSGRSDG